MSAHNINMNIPVSILYKAIAGRYRHVRVADGPISTRNIFTKNASWDSFKGYLKIYFLERSEEFLRDSKTSSNQPW